MKCVSGAIFGMATVLLGVSLAVRAEAQVPAVLPDAAQSDPVANGVMRGFPPAADKTVLFANGSLWKFPLTRWAFSHERELLPSKTVPRRNDPIVSFKRAERDLGKVEFKTMDGQRMTFTEALAKTYTDGIVVLHKGNIVYEKYFAALTEDRQHAAMSITKSFVGTIAAMLADQGKIDPSSQVTKYVPELASTAYGDATIRQVMDMTIGVRYSEDYADRSAEIWKYIVAAGAAPRAPNYEGPTTLYDFLTTLQKEGEHDQAFAYKTVNSEVLAWIVKRATGQSLADLMSSMIWSKLGAEYDAYFVLDPVGTEIGGGGLNTTLRDLARFGELMRRKGRVNNRQIIPARVVDDIERGGDKAKFTKAGLKTLPGWSYRNMWWISHNEHGAYMARGIHGQSVYIDPKSEMVIVRYASHPVAANAANDPITLPAYAAIADALIK